MISLEEAYFGKKVERYEVTHPCKNETAQRLMESLVKKGICEYQFYVGTPSRRSYFYIRNDELAAMKIAKVKGLGFEVKPLEQK